MLVSDGPALVDLAETDGQTEAVARVRPELLAGSATQQRVGEGDIVPGDDVERDDLELGTCFCHMKKGGHVSR